MHLTTTQYNAIMRAIDIARDHIAGDTFLDPYTNEKNYTNEQMLEALDVVEKKILEDNIPY